MKAEDKKKTDAQGQQSKKRAAADDDDDAEPSESAPKQSRRSRKKQKSESRVLAGARAPRHQEYLTPSSGRETYSGVEAYGPPNPSPTPWPLYAPAPTPLPPPLEVTLPVPPYWPGGRYQQWTRATTARQFTLYNEWILVNRGRSHTLSPIPNDLPRYLWNDWITIGSPEGQNRIYQAWTNQLHAAQRGWLEPERSFTPPSLPQYAPFGQYGEGRGFPPSVHFGGGRGLAASASYPVPHAFSGQYGRGRGFDPYALSSPLSYQGPYNAPSASALPNYGQVQSSGYTYPYQPPTPYLGLSSTGYPPPSAAPQSRQPSSQAIRRAKARAKKAERKERQRLSEERERKLTEDEERMQSEKKGDHEGDISSVEDSYESTESETSSASASVSPQSAVIQQTQGHLRDEITSADNADDSAACEISASDFASSQAAEIQQQSQEQRDGVNPSAEPADEIVGATTSSQVAEMPQQVPNERHQRTQQSQFSSARSAAEASAHTTYSRARSDTDNELTKVRSERDAILGRPRHDSVYHEDLRHMDLSIVAFETLRNTLSRDEGAAVAAIQQSTDSDTLDLIARQIDEYVEQAKAVCAAAIEESVPL